MTEGPSQTPEHAPYGSVDRLSSEYGIVQDKIDKIGAFRFTIRGWTVTLVTGAILAVASTHLLSPYAPLLLLLLLGVFASIESKQNRNQKIFEDRAFEIEVEIRRLLQDQTKPQSTLIQSPRIAHTLRDRSLQETGPFRRFLADPDRWFYWILVAVVLGSVLMLMNVRPQQQQPSSSSGINVNISNESGVPTSATGQNSDGQGKKETDGQPERPKTTPKRAE